MQYNIYSIHVSLKFDLITIHTHMFTHRFPPSLFKRLTSTYNLAKKDAIVWGIANESVALEQYTSLGDAVVEPTGDRFHFHYIMYHVYNATCTQVHMVIW